MKSSWETVTVDNSPMGLYLSRPEGSGPFPAIIVIQNQDGVRDFTQEMTRRVARAGYFGIAPQLYHREGEPMTPERTASIKDSRNDTNVLNDIDATIAYLRGCAEADTRNLGIVGFCMGGRSPGAFDPRRQRFLSDPGPFRRARQEPASGRDAPPRRRAN
jgi:carboxymethylenebutenolidase